MISASTKVPLGMLLAIITSSSTFKDPGIDYSSVPALPQFRAIPVMPGTGA